MEGPWPLKTRSFAMNGTYRTHETYMNTDRTARQLDPLRRAPDLSFVFFCGYSGLLAAATADEQELVPTGLLTSHQSLLTLQISVLPSVSLVG